MKKILILLFLSACTPNISDHYFQYPNQNKFERTDQVFLKKFPEHLGGDLINVLYAELELKKIEEDLVEKGEATFPVRWDESDVTLEQVTAFAKSIGARKAICYIFPGYLDVYKYNRSMMTAYAFEGSPISSTTKIIFYSSK